MKKFVIITHNMLAGGVERVIVQLVKHFSDCNVKCHIIKLNEGEVFYSLPSDVMVTSIDEKSNINVVNMIKKYIEVRKQVKKIKPDVVLAMPERIGILAIPALYGVKVPVVVSERNNPWIIPSNKGIRLMRRIFYSMATGFIFQTEQAASFFSIRIRKKGIVLPNPLDLERIPQPWDGERRKEIVGVGRLDQQKNFPLLIKAFAKFYKSHPDYALTIYGEGGLREELENWAFSLLPEGSYSFPGRTQELLERIRGAAMFVLSSDYEGMPNVVIEAMAMGMPVISTDCPSGGPAALIDDGKNGLLVPVNDREALYKAMRRVAESEDLAQKLGKTALRIKERLDAAVVAEQWREYLDAICK